MGPCRNLLRTGDYSPLTIPHMLLDLANEESALSPADGYLLYAVRLDTYDPIWQMPVLRRHPEPAFAICE